MTMKDFIRKWGTGVKGSWWLKDAGRCYWAAAYNMSSDELLVMSRDFLSLSNLNSYRATCSHAKAEKIHWDNFQIPCSCGCQADTPQNGNPKE